MKFCFSSFQVATILSQHLVNTGQMQGGEMDVRADVKIADDDYTVHLEVIHSEKKSK